MTSRIVAKLFLLVGLASTGCSSGSSPGVPDAASDAKGHDASPGDAGRDATKTHDAGRDREAHDASPTQLDLPAPSGSYAIGTQVRELIDTSRTDPQAPDAGSYRRLMVQFFYPADATDAGHVPPYLSEPEAVWVDSFGTSNFDASLPSGWQNQVHQHSRDSIPLASGGATFPVVIFSHGLTCLRTMYDVFVEDLVSHGFVVVAISHTYDSGAVVFPDASVALLNTDWKDAGGPTQSDYDLDTHISIWVADARFVLDQVTALASSDPEGLLTGRLDLARVGMFGHSYGGATAAEVCALDPRFSAGIDLDGTLYSPARPDGGRAIPTPFMIQLNATHSDADDTSVGNTWQRLGDAGYSVQIAGSLHMGFTDLELVFDTFDGPGTGSGTLGTIDPRRMLKIVNAYTLAFFEKFLKGASEPLLEGASPYSEVSFDQR